MAAEAQKEALIAVAEGENRAIELINSAKPDAAYITLQGFEALKKLADGQATKIIVPSEIQNISGLLTSMAEVVKGDSNIEKQPKKTKETTKETKKEDK